jgi:transmembrane sensor
MDKIDLLEILKKYKEGTASAEEVEFLYAYYDLFDVQEDVLLSMDPEAGKALKEEIYSGIQEKMKTKKAGSIRPIYTRYKWLAAASVILLFTIAAFLYNNRSTEPKTAGKETSKPIAEPVIEIIPGRNQATLTLADGTVIALDDKANGIISQQDGALVKKTKDGHVQYAAEENVNSIAINTIATPKGGQYRLTLADGTNVWLNAASSITFPTSFTGATREVRITGEAYFEVAKDQLHPFKVISENQVIEVLGTHFNVNTYQDEPEQKTTLLEGSVKITRTTNNNNKSGEAKILKPGQQSVIKETSEQVRVQSADLEATVAWKNGYFKFDRVDIQTIMRQVARWYDVEIEYRGKIGNDEFVGSLPRSEQVSGVLRILALAKVKTSIEGRKIIVWN